VYEMQKSGNTTFVSNMTFNGTFALNGSFAENSSVSFNSSGSINFTDFWRPIYDLDSIPVSLVLADMNMSSSIVQNCTSWWI